MTRCTRGLLAMVGVCAAACHQDAVRTFRVAMAADALPGDPAAKTLFPDACYEPDGLPAATAADQQAAEAFCAVGKRPSNGGVVSTNVITSEQWTFFDDGADQQFLVREGDSTASPSMAASTGIVGRRLGGTLSFSTITTTFGAQCAGAAANDAGFVSPSLPLIAVCDGKCVNLMSDPGHCGACDITCTNGFSCAFGRCQTTCGGGMIPVTCPSGQVDTSTDRDNCGACNNPCPPGTICSPTFGFSGPGRCMTPCEAQCARESLSDGCGRPAIITREVSTQIDVTVNGDALSGTLTQGLAFTCLDGGCAVDFGSRCPSCAVSVPVNGREITSAKSEQSR